MASKRAKAKRAANRARQGVKRYQAFLKEAKRDGNTHKQALAAYRYFKAALGEAPKRGQYREYHHLVEEAKTLPLPRRGRAPIAEERGERGGAPIRHEAPRGGFDWWESSEVVDVFEEQDEDVGSDAAA